MTCNFRLQNVSKFAEFMRAPIFSIISTNYNIYREKLELGWFWVNYFCLEHFRFPDS